MFRGLLLAVAGTTILPGPDAGAAERWRGATTLVWNDNVTNGERAEDVLAALSWQSSVGTTGQRLLAGGHRLEGSVGFRAEVWPRFEGLDQVTPEIGGAWSRKLGLGLNAPSVTASLDGSWRFARETGRGGGRAAGRVLLRQRLGAAWLFQAGHERERFDARQIAFARTSRTWFGRAEWNPGGRWWLAFEGARTEGDVVSYSVPPRPDLVQAGKPITLVDTFEQPERLLAYYFPGDTRLAALELIHERGGFGVTLRHEQRRTSHAGPGYENRITSLSLFTRF